MSSRAVLAVGRGEFGVAEAGAGAAHQHVADVGGGVAVEDEGAGLVAGAALLGDERGDLDGVAPLQRSVGAADHPAGGDEQRARGRGEGDQRGDRLAPAEALLGHARACPVGAEHGGGQEGEAVDEGGGAGPGRSRWTATAKTRPTRATAQAVRMPNCRSARSRAASAASTMPMSISAADGAGAAGAGAEQVEGGGGDGAVVEAGLAGRSRTASSVSDQGARTSSGVPSWARKRSP